MATIKAILHLSDEKQGGRLSNINITETNNISKFPNSNSIYSTNLKFLQKNEGEEVSLIKNNFSAKIGTAKYTNSYNGLLFGLTDSYKQFNLNLIVEGVDLIGLKIYFNKKTNQYPTSFDIIYYDGTSETITEENYGDDFNEEECSLVIKLKMTSDYTKKSIISFTNWKQRYSAVGITYIEVLSTDLEFRLDSIDVFESTSELSSNLEDINYGLLSNQGSLTLKDYNDTIYDSIKNEYYQIKDISVDLYYNDKMIQNHLVESNDYINETKKLSLNLTNTLDILKKVDIPEINFYEPKTMYDMVDAVILLIPAKYQILLNLYPDNFNKVLTNKILIDNEEITMEQYFSNIVIPTNFILKADTLYNQFIKICEVTQTYFNVNDEGEFKFYSARPIMLPSESDNILVIDDNIIASDLELSLITNNDYDEVKIQ